MKEGIKKGLMIAGAVVVMVGVTAALVMAHTTPRDACKELKWEISDEDVRQYVSGNELMTLLRTEGVYPVGQEAAEVQTAAIERVVREHPMVRRAECYMTSDQVCHVRLSQRIPAYRVVTPGESYLVDTDRKAMPLRAGMVLHVLTAHGSIGKRMATEELYELMQTLSRDRYWTEQLSRVEVVSPQRIQLVRKDGKVIVLGEIKDYAAKLEKYRQVDRKAFAEIGTPDCREIDLRYDRQVVTR